MTGVPKNRERTINRVENMAVQIRESYLVTADVLIEFQEKYIMLDWPTRANRVLRLYISKSKLSPSLVKVVSFLVSCYIPGWFISSNILIVVMERKTLLLSNLQSQECRDIAHTVLQNNAYWAHSENILLAALFDTNRSNR